jgi:hypothetical protein
MNDSGYWNQFKDYPEFWEIYEVRYQELSNNIKTTKTRVTKFDDINPLYFKEYLSFTKDEKLNKLKMCDVWKELLKFDIRVAKKNHKYHLFIRIELFNDIQKRFLYGDWRT